MPIFREHRGGLAESLATCIVVSCKEELEAYLKIRFSIFYITNIKIEPYPDNKNNFDARIGWFTHVVLIGYDENKEFVGGFLSESF